MRKPPERVMSIDGKRPVDDVVSDADYEDAVKAQDMTLFAQGVERKKLGKLRSRLAAGAKDGGLKYYFDDERGIVRHRLNLEVKA